MNNSLNRLLCGGTVVFAILCSCREAIDSTTDLRYEDLIVGSWVHTFQSFPGGESGSVTLIFNSNRTVRVINTSSENPIDTTYNYYIDAGVLFLTSTDDPPEIQYSYVIDQLTFSTMVLSFSVGGSSQRQTYSRTTL